METTFQKSEIYKKALAEYQEKIYWAILKPIHVIVVDNDEVYLFYNQTIVQDIFNKLTEIYNIQHEWEEESDFPESLGYEEPNLETITFMWVQYKAIKLWYDNCDLPERFEARL